MPINSGLFSSNTNEWATPQKVFDELDAEFHFDLDPCSTHENAKCERHFTIEDDGLAQDWGGQKCSAIRRMRVRLGSGSRNATRSQRNQIHWSLCSFPQGQILSGFGTTSTTRRKYASFAGACTSMRVSRALRSLR